MAEGFLRRFAPNWEVHSAGTFPGERVHHTAVQVMREKGIDISSHIPKNVDQFIGTDFEYVITVCDDARETCPVFTGKVKRRLHMGFEDPAKVTGTEEHVLAEFRRIRDEIEARFKSFAETLD